MSDGHTFRQRLDELSANFSVPFWKLGHVDMH